MKSILILGSFVLSALADPAPADAQWYTLKTKSSVDAQNNIYLSAKGGKIAGFSGARESASVGGKFFTTKYEKTLSIHSGDTTHQAGLSGVNGLLNLVDLTNPSAETIPKDTPTEWSVFNIGSGGELTVSDGQDIPSRTWVAYADGDGTLNVALWDGVTPQTNSPANISIIAEQATAPAGAAPAAAAPAAAAE